MKLKKAGLHDYVGLCPFHEEKTPSFRVTPAKNLSFTALACGAAGSVIDFVMKKDGLTKQQAIDWLVQQSNGVIQRGSAARPESRPAPPQNPAALLQRVVNFYARTLHKDRDGFDYLKGRQSGRTRRCWIFFKWVIATGRCTRFCRKPANWWTG